MQARTPLFASALALCAGLATTYSDDATACGGLFCDSSAPVNQAAERIIFAKNDDGTVTAAIEILYEGPAHQFAWVLPVPPGPVDVGVSSKNALDQLEAQSNPRYQLNREFEDCDFDAESAGQADDTASRDPAGEPNGVRVVAEGNAGPYDWKQIMVDPELAEPADAAVMWLEENGFDVSNLGPGLLGEYLEDGMNLIAFKLQKGKNAGSIRPVLLNYESERPMIPIKPTAVAANEDMGIKVWVLGDSRAVSRNYPELVLNESLIDWFNPNNSYNDVVIAAANETEDGQGFVTEQSGPAAVFAENMYPSWRAQNWTELRTGHVESLQEYLERAQQYFSDLDGFNDVLSDPELIQLREGASYEQFLSCISCYFQTDVPVRTEVYPETPYPGETDPIHAFDGATFLKKFYALVIEPLEKTRALFDEHATVTRFYTTLSPDEMTKDPEFVFNPELPDVDNLHTATQYLSCEDNKWRIELPQGVIIRGEDRTWPITSETNIPATLRVVQLSTTGEGEVLNDNGAHITAQLREMDIGEAVPGSKNDTRTNAVDDETSAAGGGCSVGATPRSSWGLLAAVGLVLPLLRRRRGKNAHV